MTGPSVQGPSAQGPSPQGPSPQGPSAEELAAVLAALRAFASPVARAGGTGSGNRGDADGSGGPGGDATVRALARWRHRRESALRRRPRT